MKIKDNGQAIIDERELLNFRNMGTEYDYGLMVLLKERGAPINGTFLLEPIQHGYIWNFEIIHAENPNMSIDRKLKYSWQKIIASDII